MNKRIIMTFTALLIIIVFMLSVPILKLIESNKIDEYVDDTGVVYLRLGNSLTPKLDKNGNLIIKNKTL